MRYAVAVFLAATFFAILFLGQNGYAGVLSFIMFLPLFFGIDFAARYRYFLLFPVFTFGILFFLANYSWLGSFFPLAPVLSAVIFSITRYAVPCAVMLFLRKRMQTGCLYVFAFASVWTICEYFAQILPFEFPYGSVALNLFLLAPFLQIMDITGQFGLTFLICLLNGLLYLVASFWIRCEWYRGMKILTSAVLITVLWTGYGIVSTSLLRKERDIFVGLAQSSIPAHKKARMSTEEYLESIDLLLSHIDQDSALVIFPETFFYDDISDPDNVISRYLSAQSENRNISIAGGFLERQDAGPFFMRNSFFLMNNGKVSSLSHKEILAPFGEYYPFGSMFPEFRKKLSTRQGAFFFNRGDSSILHRYHDRNGVETRFRTLICYEAAFGKLLRGTAISETDFLVSVSSDLWTRSHRAMIQNAIFSRYRAIEYRIPVVRVSNGGISGYVSATGRTWLPVPAFTQGNAHIRVVKTRHVLYRNRTIYSFCGDCIIVLCFFVFLRALYAIRENRKS